MREGEKHTAAKELRAAMTEPERRIWERLRRRQIDGARFRRQVPVGPFDVDFACIERRLIVEIDGETHGYSEAYDARRTSCFEAKVGASCASGTTT